LVPTREPAERPQAGLAERRSGYVIILLGSLLGAVVPVIHFMGKGVAKPREFSRFLGYQKLTNKQRHLAGKIWLPK
jgi:hypothetical protein